jgi:hypothetical protein
VLQFEVKTVQDTVKIREYSHDYCIKFELFYFDSNCARRTADRDAAGVFAMPAASAKVPARRERSGGLSQKTQAGGAQ